MCGKTSWAKSPTGLIGDAREEGSAPRVGLFAGVAGVRWGTAGTGRGYTRGRGGRGGAGPIDPDTGRGREGAPALH